MGDVTVVDLLGVNVVVDLLGVNVVVVVVVVVVVIVRCYCLHGLIVLVVPLTTARMTMKMKYNTGQEGMIVGGEWVWWL